MVDRSVKVKLKADISNFQRGFRTATRDAVGLEGALATLDGRLASVQHSQDSATDSQTALNRSWNNGGRTLDKYNKGLSGAESGLGKLDSRTQRLGQDTTSLSGKLRAASDDTERYGRSANSAGKEIDKLSGRVGIWMDLLATAGPALIPIGAGALPALAGITAGLGAAAGAFGVTLLAVKGLGDGLKALDAYQLEPTAANLAKVQDQFHKLGPAGAEFVSYLDDLEPKLKDLQMLARAGLLPGLEGGIDGLLQRLPQVKSIITDISTAVGDVAKEAGQNLGGPKFDGFFDYVEHRAGPILHDFAQSAGNVGEGLANMLVAFDPATKDFESGLLGMTQHFAAWSRTLDTNTGFQDFLAYARENGPKVVDLIGALIGALSSIAEAAAPVGSVVLPILTDLLKVLGAVADSDIGTPIFAGLAALAAYNRVLQVTAALQARAFGASEATSVAGGKGGLFSAQAGSIKGGFNALLQVTSAQDRARLSASELQKAEEERTRAVKGGLATLGKSAALIGGLALVTSGATDKLGLNNAALGVMVGSMAGPWGAAVGGGIGLLKDFASANDDVEKSVITAQDALNGVDFSAMSAAVAAAQKQSGTLDEKHLPGWTKGIPIVGSWANIGYNHIHGNQVDSANSDLEHLQATLLNNQQAAAGLAKAMGLTVPPLDGSAKSATALTSALASAQPAMDKLNISAQGLDLDHSLQALSKPGSLGGAFFASLGIDVNQYAHVYDNAVHRISGTTKWLNSTAGREHAVSDALKHIGDTATAAVDPVDALSQSLSDLLDPAVSFRDAQNSFASQLSSLKSNLAKKDTLTSGMGLPIGPADAKNRQVVDDLTRGLHELLVQQAGVDDSSTHLAKTFREQRQSIVDTAVAAGLHRKDVEAYLKTLHLAPKDVNTVIHAAVEQARQNAAAVRNDLRALPKDVRAAIKLDGVPQTKAQAQSLATQFDLVGKPRDALIRLVDDAAKAGIANITQLLNHLNGKTATTYIRTVQTGANHAGVQDSSAYRAHGGLMVGPGGPTDDKIPAMLSNREYVVKAAAVDKYGVGFFDRANALRLAKGGVVGRDQATPLFDGEGPRYYKAAYKHGKPFAVDGPSHWDWPYQTGFSGKHEADAFNRWVEKNHVPFDADAKVVDYDMRGYWKKTHGRGWHQGSHFPDTYKTPYDTTFSHESKYATKDNPFYWHGDRLVDQRNGQLIFAASGGLIRGPGGPRDDKVPAWLSSGEYVVNAHATAANRGTLDAINRGANPWGDVRHQSDEVSKGLKGMKERLKDAQKALEDEQAQLQRMKTYRASVAGSLSGELFGNGLAGFNLAATANRNDNRSATAALKRAAGKGLDGPLFAALAASGDLSAIEQFAGLSKGGIRKEELLYGSAMRSDSSLASYATTQKFGETIADQQSTIKHLDKTIRDLTHAVNQMEHRVERGARKGTHDGTKDRNRSTATRTRTGR